MKKLFFGRITLLRGAHPLAVIQHTVSGFVRRAPRTAFQNFNFFKVNDGVY